jgi:two-component system alkaline phosphatase synthesis response regulator PhoP
MADNVTTRRVLIVDDEPNIVMSLEFLMRKSGFETSVARDLLLLDAMMPHRDGFEVCQQLRAAGWGDLKIIMLTAKGRETEIAKGLAVGADAYVTKPFSTRDLVDRVTALLAGGG